MTRATFEIGAEPTTAEQTRLDEPLDPTFKDSEFAALVAKINAHLPNRKGKDDERE